MADHNERISAKLERIPDGDLNRLSSAVKDILRRYNNDSIDENQTLSLAEKVREKGGDELAGVIEKMANGHIEYSDAKEQVKAIQKGEVQIARADADQAYTREEDARRRASEANEPPPMSEVIGKISECLPASISPVFKEMASVVDQAMGNIVEAANNDATKAAIEQRVEVALTELFGGADLSHMDTKQAQSIIQDVRLNVLNDLKSNPPEGVDINAIQEEIDGQQPTINESLIERVTKELGAIQENANCQKLLEGSPHYKSGMGSGM